MYVAAFLRSLCDHDIWLALQTYLLRHLQCSKRISSHFFYNRLQSAIEATLTTLQSIKSWPSETEFPVSNHDQKLEEKLNR